MQVDDALKQFQKALRLHAQGARSRDAAQEAYDELFDSEIFKYREARTEYERNAQSFDGQADTASRAALSVGLDLDAGGADGVAASLAQALYISYKNYGQFFLDKLKDSRNSDSKWNKRGYIAQTNDGAQKILDNWLRALDQDPSDPELWRKAARFAAATNSSRIKRFCLEAAIELDDDPTIAEVEPPSIAEGLAGQQLKDHLRTLDDQMALSHPVMAPWRTKEMSNLLKQFLDPIPYLPDPTSQLTPPPSSPEDSAKEDTENKEGTEKDADESETPDAVASWTDLATELIKHADDNKEAILSCKRVLNSNLDDEMAESSDDGPGAEISGDGDKTEEVEAQSRKESEPANERQSSEASVSAPTAAEQSQKERSASAPTTRKRSQSVAGLQEGEDDNATEKRSKRVRRRTDLVTTEESVDPSVLIANKLQPYQESDQHLFRVTRNILESLGIEDEHTLQYITEILEQSAADERPAKPSRTPAQDLRYLFTDFTKDSASVLLNKTEQPVLGLSSFLEHTKSSAQDDLEIKPFKETAGLRKFAERVELRHTWVTVGEIAFDWIKAMSESYSEFKWSDALKTAVMDMLNKYDAEIYASMTEALNTEASIEQLKGLEAMIPMIFELHVDAYEGIKNPSSAADKMTREEAKYRLDRWLDVASKYTLLLDQPEDDPSRVRFLWASVLTSSLADDPVREHILLLWKSLRDLLVDDKVEAIALPNNVAMSMISPEAAEREISKLTTMDFFLSLFHEDMKSPIQMIDILEPVLNPSSVHAAMKEPESKDEKSDTEMDTADKEKDDGAEKAPEDPSVPVLECANQSLRDLWKFLEDSNTELRLVLWSRLGDAYEAIGYATKRFACLMQSIQMIIDDLDSEKFSHMSDASRRLSFMRLLRSLDDLLVQALSLALNDTTAFDIIDEDGIKAGTAALVKVSTLLHNVSLLEDEIRAGLVTVPSNNSTFQAQLNKLREIQIRSWCLLYTLFRACFASNESQLNPETDLMSFLAAVHLGIGIRKFCKASNKVFLKMMRAELLKAESIENWEDYIGQVLYDLYGLKLGIGIWEVQDHGCPSEKLEKRQTMQLVQKIIMLANRMPIKDLLKSDLKTTIDHMQQTIGQTKSTPQMIHNLRNFTEMLKRPIHPLRLHKALFGGAYVDAVSVGIPEAALAKHGWFFLLGMIALTKFKGVDLNRRQTPGATDDLRIGATFLRLQLQFTADRWDAWFRLAECFDYELDEAVLWSAEKMNKDRAELLKFQRNAIHCYTLALSHSRHMEIGTSDGDPLHDLYYKFAMRMYSSSREPFAMEPFQHSDQERFFIENSGSNTFKKILHDQMTEYQVWKYAARLFKLAIDRKPTNWK